MIRPLAKYLKLMPSGTGGLLGAAAVVTAIGGAAYYAWRAKKVISPLRS